LEQRPNAHGWFLTSIILASIYTVFGLIYLLVIPLLGGMVLVTALLAFIGIGQYRACRYGAAAGLLLAAGILGLPLGILFIIAGTKMGNLVSAEAADEGPAVQPKIPTLGGWRRCEFCKHAEILDLKSIQCALTDTIVPLEGTCERFEARGGFG
jgi:hypothetical protein